MELTPDAAPVRRLPDVAAAVSSRVDRKRVHGIGRCPDCGKRRFRDRRDAKASARQRCPGEPVGAYRCGAYWHWGHRPRDVRNGTLDKDDWLGNTSGEG